MNMPIIYIKEIKTTLLTLFGRILGFIGGKMDSAPNNTRFMTSPSEFTSFQILNFQLFQFSHLLEVVVIRRKKLAGEIPTHGTSRSTGVKVLLERSYSSDHNFTFALSFLKKGNF
jgi:hypothetical protein